MDRHPDIDVLGPDVAREVSRLVGSDVVGCRPLSGGDVAASYRVELADRRVVFAKTHANPRANFFDTEASGLEWLRQVAALPVPRVFAVSDDPPMLVLEWIDEKHGGPRDEAAFGRGLAALHRSGAPCFGREDRRTTGSRGLPNEPCETCAHFYMTQRLLPLTRLAVETGTYEANQIRVFESVAHRLEELGDTGEPAARLHGDLWAGNRIVDTSGTSWLIDPACHGGHREFDLAMMRLFGGFGPEAFAAYNEVYPLAPGASDRVELHQLAPLLVHAIKFGGSYVTAALAAAQRYR